MTQVFGERDDFAIEAGVEADGHTAGTVWGHMAVWCRGVALGDAGERFCALHHAYGGLRRVSAHLDELWAPDLAGLDDGAAWNLLDGLLYSYHGEVETPDDRSLEQCQADAVAWGRFDFLTNWGEPFDGCKAFLLHPPGGPLRALYRTRTGHPSGVRVSPAGFREAVGGFAHWFERRSQRLGVPC